jgi:hypothetical protein
MEKKTLFILGALVATFLLGSGTSGQVHAKEIKLIKEGDLFPEVPLPVPLNPKDRVYLGLPEGKTFTFKDIKADLVLVEILSVYCASCQAQAPTYNKLYALIEDDPKTKGRIKLLGIGAGNGDIEVNDFRQNYKIPFPIIPDPQFVMHEAIGGSRTPFSIYVRQDLSVQQGLVAGTHLGTNYKTKELFNELAGLATTDLASIRKEGEKKEAETVFVEPILTAEQLRAKVKDAFASLGGQVKQFEELALKSATKVYSALLEREAGAERLFAEVVSRPSVCDLCHDVHFIYLFDFRGKVLGLVPLLLTKYDNEPWDEADLGKMRSRVVGRYLYKPFVFDAKVDAVSSATMTSALIFDSLSKGQALMEELKEKGLI